MWKKESATRFRGQSIIPNGNPNLNLYQYLAHPRCKVHCSHILTHKPNSANSVEWKIIWILQPGPNIMIGQVISFLPTLLQGTDNIWAYSPAQSSFTQFGYHTSCKTYYKCYFTAATRHVLTPFPLKYFWNSNL